MSIIKYVRWIWVRIMCWLGLRPLTIAIEGSIGAGKTTFLRHLQDRLLRVGFDVRVVCEPVDKWIDVGILNRFYEDEKKYAALFQMFAFVTRAVEAVQGVLTGDRGSPHIGRKRLIILTERSLLADRYVFAEMLKKHFSPADIIVYETMWNSLKKHTVWPDLVIHLDASPQTCLDRIIERARGAEHNILIAYLIDLCKQYQKFVSTVGVPVVHIDAEKNIATDLALREQALQSVTNRLAVCPFLTPL